MTRERKIKVGWGGGERILFPFRPEERDSRSPLVVGGFDF